MLTKEQAVAVGDEVLAQQRRDLLESKNRRARRVGWVYQVPGLSARQPFEQAEMFVEAGRRVAKSVPYWSVAMSWLCLTATTWYWATPGDALSPLFAAAAVLGIQWFRIAFVRKQLTQLVCAPPGEQ